MRTFSSYGPVNCKKNFYIPRKELIKTCIKTLVDDPDEGGRYFTIWGPRQTGKTWVMQQVIDEIPVLYKDKFAICEFSAGGVRGMKYSIKDIADTDRIPNPLSGIFEDALPGSPVITTWKDFRKIFSKNNGLWDRPLIMLIDEIDTIPGDLLDLMVGQFRELYLHRKENYLHGLALTGVRAVLGMDSQKGSPFNVQKSMHIQNFTKQEVIELYRQYQEESDQVIKPEIVSKVFEITNGQPGIVSWFGELLTEKYNPGKDKAIDMNTWKYAYHGACNTEYNATILNLIAKAKNEYTEHVLRLFSNSDIKFSLDEEWCNYMYMHGLITYDKVINKRGKPVSVCRFSCHFIQYRIYNALTHLMNHSTQSLQYDLGVTVLALEPLDDLGDVFDGPRLKIPALLERYKNYLMRLKTAGINPWEKQPRRKTDFHLTEAVGHFHLFSWLEMAVGRRCTVSPEFPTGNGTVDIHLEYYDKRSVIEVKSFTDTYQAKEAMKQAAAYGKKLEFDSVTVAMFAPFTDQDILAKLSDVQVIENVNVTMVAIGQG